MVHGEGKYLLQLSVTFTYQLDYFFRTNKLTYFLCHKTLYTHNYTTEGAIDELMQSQKCSRDGHQVLSGKNGNSEIEHLATGAHDSGAFNSVRENIMAVRE